MTDENRELLPQYTRQTMNFSYGNPVITHRKNLDSAKYFADPFPSFPPVTSLLFHSRLSS